MSDGNISDAQGIRDIASAASRHDRAADAAKPEAPIVTPNPVPSDENLMKLVCAAAAGAVVGSFVAYRWLSRRFVVSFRGGD